MVEKIRELGETRVTVSFTVVLGLLVAIFTGLLSWQFVQDAKTIAISDRVTQTETCLKNIQSDQIEMKTTVNAIRTDQVMFYRAINPRWESSVLRGK